jgi:hypothetical protein
MAGGYRALGVMEARLAQTPFLGGETYTLADIALYAYTHVAHDAGIGFAAVTLEKCRDPHVQPGDRANIGTLGRLVKPRLPQPVRRAVFPEKDPVVFGLRAVAPDHAVGPRRAAELLEQTLDEEKAADEKLTSIAEGSVNSASVRPRM